ncbi:hypothetical protein GCM10023063_18590 [Arthrobacter methylotrophus]|uniref:Uncharacterized protein n=1 Tax=Arthrobacter methylotrophus TaxID=121291 RepID=A0ABV5UP21_9MICC
MSTLKIPVLSGYRQSSISLGGSAPVRAWVDATGEASAVVPHMDLIRMIRQEPLLRLTFLGDGAVLSRAGSDFMVALPLVFLEGVGLKSYDLSGAGLPIYEAGSPSVAA